MTSHQGQSEAGMKSCDQGKTRRETAVDKLAQRIYEKDKPAWRHSWGATDDRVRRVHCEMAERELRSIGL